MASEHTDMMDIIDLSALPPNVPSLCIPRVFKNITRERVFNCFKDLGIGFVERIDMVPRKADNGDEFQRVFVHLRWNKSEQASKARSRVLSGKEIKIIYDEPWFWKVSANRSVSRDSTSARDSRDSRPGDRPRATLALEDDDIEGNIRKIKAQNDRDRKDGRFPSGHKRRQNERPPRAQKYSAPRSPSNSPPQRERVPSPSPSPSASRVPSASCVPSASRVPSASYDVDAPGTNALGTAINYGDISIPSVKRKRVVKKPVVLAEAPVVLAEAEKVEVFHS